MDKKIIKIRRLYHVLKEQDKIQLYLWRKIVGIGVKHRHEWLHQRIPIDYELKIGNFKPVKSNHGLIEFADLSYLIIHLVNENTYIDFNGLGADTYICFNKKISAELEILLYYIDK